MMNEAAVTLCAKLYRARDSMRRFWGEKYKAKLAEYMPFIVEKMPPGDTADAIPITMELVRRLQENVPDSGMAQALLFACCVEIIEPTPGL